MEPQTCRIATHPPTHKGTPCPLCYPSPARPSTVPPSDVDEPAGGLDRRIRHILIAETHERARNWQADHPFVNPRDVIRVVEHRDLQRVRGHDLSKGNWRVHLLGAVHPSVPWREYLEAARWDGELS